MATIYGTNNDFQVPSLDLRFADRKNLVDTISGRNLITFSRNSIGTYVDENGVIQSAASGEARFDHDPVTGESLGLLVEESRTNLETYSEVFTDSSWQKTDSSVLPNIIVSPDGLLNGTKVVENTNNAAHGVYKNYGDLTFGVTYTYSVFAKAAERTTLQLAASYSLDYANFNLSTGAITYATSGSNASIVALSNGWYKCSSSFTPSSVALVRPFVLVYDTDNPSLVSSYTGNGTSGIYIWGAQLEAGSFPTSYIPTPATFTSRASTATYYDASGVIQTAGVNVARDNAYFPDENGVMQPAGLLLEGSGTNLVTYSEDLTIWGQYGVTITSNAVTAPDGLTTADKMYSTAGASLLAVQRAIYGLTSGAQYTRSVFLKAAELTSATMQISNTTEGSIFCTIDLIAGTSTGGGVVTKLSNGWYRLSRSFTQSGTVNDWYITLTPSSPANNGIYVWGAQLEASTYLTSYIPTAGSTVTRAADVSSSSTVTRVADVATLTNSNIYNTEAFTITNEPFGASGGSNTLSLVGPNIKRTSVYSSNLSQATINKIVRKTDEFWRWRVTGGSFGLPSFTTDGQVTVDWGDGTVETLTTSDHAFTDGKTYHEIGFRLDSGTYFRPRINANSTHKDKLIAIGPAPESMKIRAQEAFNGCTNLQAFDPTIAANGETNYSYAWQSCSSLKNFPLIDTSGVTYMLRTWRFCSGLENFAKIDTSSVTSLYETWDSCSSLTSFPVIDSSNVTNFSEAWDGCSSLTEFPVLDTSKGTSFSSTWQSCSSLTEFPVLDTSKGTSFTVTWRYCGGLTSFPALDFSSATGLDSTWMGCSGLTSFPTLTTTSLVQSFSSTWYGCGQLTTIPICDYSAGTTFSGAWVNCGNLTTIPANLFDTTGTLAANAFSNAFVNDSLSAQSIENLLVSLVANGATGVTLNMNGGGNANTSTWSTAANNAYLELVNNRGWTITQNGTAPT